MLLPPSSPIAFPSSSSPPRGKRPRVSEAPKPQQPTVRRLFGGFVDDNDDEDEDAGSGFANTRLLPDERSPKRRMLDKDHVETQVSVTEHDAQVLPDLGMDSGPLNMTATPPRSMAEDGADEETQRYDRLFGASRDKSPPPFPPLAVRAEPRDSTAPYHISTCAGKSVPIRERKTAASVSYESMVAARSRTKEGRAKRSYYGIEIHELIDAANQQAADTQKAAADATAAAAAGPPPPSANIAISSVEDSQAAPGKRPKRTMLWTEKYRARTFMDLVGDDFTNRQVLRWLKHWDPIVFPHAAREKALAARKRAKQAGLPQQQRQQQQHQHQHHQQYIDDEAQHRRILLLAGPPGLGKTTVAHVCARQAGYEVMEINASDERSRDVVRGRIRTSLGTESVKTVGKISDGSSGKPGKAIRPVCVIVDEVDGVVGGSGGSGEGGFVKALIDLMLLDQKNSAGAGKGSSDFGERRRKKKGDDFRQMRPLILVCNDVYHPSLRPLRQSGLAEIVHAGKPAMDAVVTRLKNIFEMEGIPCEKDAARKLCEAAWGIASGADTRRSAESNVEGDLRGVLVVGEWVARRLRASAAGHGHGAKATDPKQQAHQPRLTRLWVDQHVLSDLAHGGGAARSLGRGSVREIVSRIFQEGGGFPRQLASDAAEAEAEAPKNIRHELPRPKEQVGFAEQRTRYAMARLREMMDTSGETDRIMTDVFSEWPTRDFNDDSFLSKPDAAYEWMHFHDACATRVFGSQEWELGAYVSQAALACHQLFSSPRNNYHSSNANGNSYQAGQRRGGSGGGGAADGGPTGNDGQAPTPFSGPRADFLAFEAEKANRASLQALHMQLPPTLSRAFRSPETLAADLLPYLIRLISPAVKPVLIGGGGGTTAGLWTGPVASVRRDVERAMVTRAALVLAEIGISLQKGKLEAVDAGPMARAQWVYRLEPDLDALSTYETAGAQVLAQHAPTRYAVRQVLDQELQKTLAQRELAARQARFQAGKSTKAGHEALPTYDLDGNKENAGGRGSKFTGRPGVPSVTSVGNNGKLGGGMAAAAAAAATQNVRKDFFGRIIADQPLQEIKNGGGDGGGGGGGRAGNSGTHKPDINVFVTFNEGLNNAVTKPLSIEDFLRGF